MKKNKGFTLIELLVVIAIIGILSSVVLASLSSARNKGKDAAVKSQLASMKSQAELFYATGETYASICTTPAASNGFGDTTGPGLLKAASDSAAIANSIVVDIATIGAYNQVTCHATADAWAVEAPMNDSVSGTPSMYCSDSTGVSKTKATVLAANGIAC